MENVKMYTCWHVLSEFESALHSSSPYTHFRTYLETFTFKIRAKSKTLHVKMSFICMILKYFELPLVLKRCDRPLG